MQGHKYRTNHFVQWCDESDIHNMNDLTGRDLQAFRLWQQEDGDLKTMSLNQQTSAIRVFMKWCGSIEAIQPHCSSGMNAHTSPRRAGSAAPCTGTADTAI